MAKSCNSGLKNRLYIVIVKCESNKDRFFNVTLLACVFCSSFPTNFRLSNVSRRIWGGALEEKKTARMGGVKGGVGKGLSLSHQPLPFFRFLPFDNGICNAGQSCSLSKRVHFDKGEFDFFFLDYKCK